MSRMPNPGEIFHHFWLEPLSLSITYAARKLGVSRKALSKIINSNAGISADMALRLSAWLGTTPDVWLGMQAQWDLWQAEQLPRPKIKPLERMAA